MKRLLAVAAFLLASSAAQAQYTFDYGGRTIRIDPDRGTVSIPGVYDNTGRRKRAHSDRDSDRPRKQTPEQAKVEPLAPVQPDPAPATTAAPSSTTPEPSSTTANVAPADTTASPPPADTSAPVQQDAAPSSRRRRLRSQRHPRPRHLRPCNSRLPPLRHQPLSRRTLRSACGSRKKRKARSGSSSAAPISAAIPWTRSRTRMASRS